MGFESSEVTLTHKTFVSIINGKFAIKATENTPNAVKRYSEKKQHDVWEVVHASFEGMIKSLEIKDTSFGTQLSILMEDVGDLYEFQIPTESRYFGSICDKIENVNLKELVKLVPYNFESKDEKNSKGEPKKITGMNIFQGKNKVANYYSKDFQGNKPKYPTNITESNKKIFYIQQEEFFKELISEINRKNFGGQTDAPINENNIDKNVQEIVDLDPFPF